MKPCLARRRGAAADAMQPTRFAVTPVAPAFRRVLAAITRCASWGRFVREHRVANAPARMVKSSATTSVSTRISVAKTPIAPAVRFARAETASVLWARKIATACASPRATAASTPIASRRAEYVTRARASADRILSHAQTEIAMKRAALAQPPCRHAPPAVDRYATCPVTVTTACRQRIRPAVSESRVRSIFVQKVRPGSAWPDPTILFAVSARPASESQPPRRLRAFSTSSRNSFRSASCCDVDARATSSMRSRLSFSA